MYMVKAAQAPPREIIMFLFRRKRKRWDETLYWRTIRWLARYSETLYGLYQKRIRRDPFYLADDHW